MSDYITILAAKMLNLTEMVQPRLASLFEPQGASGTVAEDGFGLATAPVEQVADDSAWSPASPVPRRPQDAVASRLSGPEARRPPQAAPGQSVDATSAPQYPSQSTRQELPLQSESQTSQTRAPQPRVAQTPGPREGAPLIPQPSDTSRSQPRPDQQGPLPGTAEHDHSAVPSRRTDVPGRLSAPAHHQPAVATPGAARHVTSAPRMSHAVPATTPVTAPGQPHVVPYVEPRVPAPAPTEPQTTPAPAPTIRVTIGRLEVRAMTPSAPQKPSATQVPRAPLLTLDEYLKQRNEGRS